MSIDTLNFILALGGIAAFGAAFILVFDIASKNLSLKILIDKFALIGAFALTACGSVLTLVYSDVFGFVPCGLCWLQRVFLYSQVFVLGTALYTRDKNVWKYGIALSIPGLILSLYQHYLQMGGNELITCPTTSAGANCAERILFEFGFVTFPLISAGMFVLLIAVYWYLRVVSNSKK
jgi:disulfide bond formation protein DsbB